MNIDDAMAMVPYDDGTDAINYDVNFLIGNLQIANNYDEQFNNNFVPIVINGLNVLQSYLMRSNYFMNVPVNQVLTASLPAIVTNNDFKNLMKRVELKMDAEMVKFNEENKEDIDAHRIAEGYDYELHQLTEGAIRPTLEAIFGTELEDMGFRITRNGLTKVLEKSKAMIEEYEAQVKSLKKEVNDLLIHVSTWDQDLSNALSYEANSFRELPSAELEARLRHANEQVSKYQTWQLAIKYILYLRCKKFIIFSTLINYLHESLNNNDEN